MCQKAEERITKLATVEGLSYNFHLHTCKVCGEEQIAYPSYPTTTSMREQWRISIEISRVLGSNVVVAGVDEEDEV